MTRAVCGNGAETYSSCSKFTAGAESRARNSCFVAILSDCEALQRADVYARIAFNTFVRGENGLHVAVQTSLDFIRRLLGAKPEFHFDVQLLKPLSEVDVSHLLPADRIVVVVIAPLADAHLLAQQIHP